MGESRVRRSALSADPRDRDTRVTPGVNAPAPALTLGFSPGYMAAWLGYDEPPQVYEREVYISEKSKQLVWHGQDRGTR